MSKVIVDEIQTDTTNGNVRVIPNGTGALEVKGAGGDDAILQLNCSAQSHGVKLKSPAHSAGQSYTMILPDNQVAADKYLKVKSITGSGATAVGQLEFGDVAAGVSSDANYNTAAGTNAGASFGSGQFGALYNTMFGYDAGTSITTSNDNTGIGFEALKSQTTGDNTGGNTAIGSYSLKSATTGASNTAVGYKTLENTTGNLNVAVGYEAMKNNTSGYANTAIGLNALKAHTSGGYNTAAGYDSGKTITSGTNNTCLGRNAGTSSSPSGSITTGSNNVVLGDNNVTNLYCADTGISSSDSRDKTDVASFTIGLNWIEALRPVTYRWDRRTWYGTDEEPYGTPDGSKKRQRLHLGFLAQEALAVEQANGYGTNNDDSLILNLTEDGMSYGMKYERLVPILVNAIKELSARVKTLEGG